MLITTTKAETGGVVISIGSSAKIEMVRDYGSLTVELKEDGTLTVCAHDGDGKLRKGIGDKAERIIDAYLTPPAELDDQDSDDGDDLFSNLAPLDEVPTVLKEAGIGKTPNPLLGEQEGQETSRQEEGEGQGPPRV